MLITKERRNRYCFIMEMEVRDYELDCEQIVNNANYLHYMEHTRHCFCREAGLPFIEMHRQGIDVVVRKIEVEYQHSLRSGDTFLSGIRLERQGPKFVFHQDIFMPGGEMITRGIVTVVCTKNGKVTRGDEIAQFFTQYFA